jgi:error-prone DNA polymerase
MAWDRDGAAAARLVKIDLLGNRSLAVLRDTLHLVQRRSDGASPATLRSLSRLEERLSPRQLQQLQDPSTLAMIAGGDTLGLFYIESPATRQLLRRMGRADFEHLIMAGSIIRPAANRTIQRFLERLHGAAYRSLTPVLDQSYGLMVYQEDIGRVTSVAAGFEPAEADRLRRILAGKQPGEDPQGELRAYRNRFFDQGRSRGMSGSSLKELWEMISSFRGYSFCKAHSASYALVSLKLAFLKRRFPLEFFLSVINNGGGYYSRQTYLNECRRLGIGLLLPDVNASAIPYSAEGAKIRVGLNQLRGISRSFLGRLLSERSRNGPFTGCADFYRRVKPRLQETRILVRSGALDGIAHGQVRPQLLWSYLRREEVLFVPQAPSLADYPEQLKLLDELRTLGLAISRHPVTLFRPRALQLARRLGMPPLIRSTQMAEFPGREVALIGLVACGKEVITRRGAAMVFVSLDDEFSLFEAVLFPPVYRRFRDGLEGGGVLLLSGTVEGQRGAWALTVRRLSRLPA